MTKKLTFCSLMAVLGILSLALSNILQTNTIALYALSTIFTYICVEEYGIKYGLLTYAVITLAGFIFAADKLSIIAYAIIVGYYPVVKHIIEHFEVNKILKWVIKITFILLVSSIALLILKSFIAVINIPLIFAIGIGIFVVYDIVLTMGIKFYALRLRRFR